MAHGEGNGTSAPARVRNVAQEHGVDLDRVPGSGPQGRITKADVMSYLDTGGVGPAAVGIVIPDGSARHSRPGGARGRRISQSAPPQTFPGAPCTSGRATIPPPVDSVP